MNYLQRVAEAGARTAVPYRAPVGVRLFGTEANGALDAGRPAGAVSEDTVAPSAPASPSPVAAIGVPPPDLDRPMRAPVAGDVARPRTATPIADEQSGAPAQSAPGVAAPATPGRTASHVTRTANAAATVTVRVPRGFADPPPAAPPSATGASSSHASSREASSSASAASAAGPTVPHDAATPAARANASSSAPGSAASPLTPLSPADARTVPQSSPSLTPAADSAGSATGASQQAASAAARAQHLAEHAAATARPSIPRGGMAAETPSPNTGETATRLDTAALDRAARVAVPLDREAAGTMRAGNAPRTSVTIGTVDVYVAPPPQPVAPPPREAPRAAAPRRSAVETRFLDRFLLGG